MSVAWKPVDLWVALFRGTRTFGAEGVDRGAGCVALCPEPSSRTHFPAAGNRPSKESRTNTIMPGRMPGMSERWHNHWIWTPISIVALIAYCVRIWIGRNEFSLPAMLAAGSIAVGFAVSIVSDWKWKK